jgi:DNA-binding response OmpR family regulator
MWASIGERTVSELLDICEHCSQPVFAKDVPYVRGDISIHLSRREVIYKGQEMRFTPVETEILQLLVKRAPNTVRAETIQMLFFDEKASAVNMVAVLMSRIRKKFREVGFDNAITTHWGQGFVWGGRR